MRATLQQVADAKVTGRRVKKRAAAKRSGSPSIEDLIAAKKLADQLGGVEQARAAIAVLAKLL